MRLHSIRFPLALLAAVLGVLALASSAHAGNPAAPGTEVIWLLKNCAAASHSLGTDCFQTVADLQNKIWGSGGLNPTSATPLVVDIGPGDFSGTLICNEGGYVTFRGMGRDRSRLIASDTPVFYRVTNVYSPLRVTHCEKLAFQDMALVAPQTSGFGGYGVAWDEGGSSSWTNVDIEAFAAAWYDICSPEPGDPPLGEHYFWGAKLTGRNALGYFAACDQSWLYGSEIETRQDYSFSGVGKVRGVQVQGSGEVQLFGSSIKVHVGGITSTTHDLVGAEAGLGSYGPGYGQFHMHGGAIAVDATKGVNAIGIEVDKVNPTDPARAHTFETAFAITAGAGGTPTRLAGDGNFESPFLWQQGTDVPVAGLVSITGADMFVETDCNSSGCSGSGTDPHLMIYKSSCSSGWFDLVRQACR